MVTMGDTGPMSVARLAPKSCSASQCAVRTLLSMKTHTPKPTATIVSLRRRAQSLRRQALWTQQAFLDGGDRRIQADVVHEVLALQEESRELDQLADHYEKRCERVAA